MIGRQARRIRKLETFQDTQHTTVEVVIKTLRRLTQMCVLKGQQVCTAT